MKIQGFSWGPGDGRSVDNPGGGVLTFKATDEQTGGALTAIETIVDAGFGPPLHVHANLDEFIYFIEGRFQVRLAEQLTEAAPGTFVFIPQGTAHTWQNIGDGPGRFFAGTIPASPGFEQFFSRYAQLAPDEKGAAAFSRLAADTAAMEVLGPPLAASD